MGWNVIHNLHRNKPGTCIMCRPLYLRSLYLIITNSGSCSYEHIHDVCTLMKHNCNKKTDGMHGCTNNAILWVFLKKNTPARVVLDPNNEHKRLIFRNHTNVKRGLVDMIMGELSVMATKTIRNTCPLHIHYPCLGDIYRQSLISLRGPGFWTVHLILCQGTLMCQITFD